MCFDIGFSILEFVIQLDESLDECFISLVVVGRPRNIVFFPSWARGIAENFVHKGI